MELILRRRQFTRGDRRLSSIHIFVSCLLLLVFRCGHGLTGTLRLSCWFCKEVNQSMFESTP